MPLLNLRTTLKDLKWGNDRFGGGNSGQPYIKTPIPDGHQPISDEGIIRGGLIGSTKASINDVKRIGKFLLDAPKGPLFITKQVGLQLSNPKLPVNPLPLLGGSSFFSNIINSGINFLNNNNPGTTRLYNLGINTLAQVGVNNLGIHFERHGLLPVMADKDKYINIVKNLPTDNNKLVTLRNKLLVKDDIGAYNSPVSTPQFLSSLGINFSNIINKNNFNIASSTTQDNIIDRYFGGPNSHLGIGYTTIRRYDYTKTFKNSPNSYTSSIKEQDNSNLFDTNRLLIFNGLREKAASSGSNPRENRPSPLDLIAGTTGSDQKTIINSGNYNTQLKVLGESRKKFYIDDRLHMGTPGDLNRDKSDYNSNVALDKLTSLPIFRASSPGEVENESNGYPLRDMIKFRFEAINNDNPTLSDFIIFRAFLNGSVNMPYSANWSSIKYNGRGEQFFVYDGFSSNINFGFKLAAQSRAEMKPMYQKLNYLISNLAPDYKNNRMRGPLMKLTIGNLIYRQPGFITNLTVDVTDEFPWEIALNEPERLSDDLMLELPQILNVDCSFTPIYNFLPQKSIDKSPFIADKGNEGKEGERWIINAKIKDTSLIKDIK